VSRVLVATAGTEYDRDAVTEAVGLLGQGHRYLFLSVYQGVVATAASLEGMWAPAVVIDNGEWENADQAAMAMARGRLQQIVDRLEVDAELRVESGDPAERICTIAAEEKVDLIVVGSPHSSVLRRVLGGSTSDYVAHHAKCPVLLVRRAPADSTDSAG
jgi:nucleotide-binding universal stress UspA family protein